jgi:undecaprenyl-diphosphatase
MTLLQILILAVIQGVCELLPVSSSAHVIMAEKIMGIDPTSPEMTLLLVILHTGTMLAVIVYFWKVWQGRYFSSMASFTRFMKEVIVATVLTGVIGLVLLQLIEKVVLAGAQDAEIEQIFGNAYIIATGLAAVGVMIILSSRQPSAATPSAVVGFREAAWIGAALSKAYACHSVGSRGPVQRYRQACSSVLTNNASRNLASPWRSS